jgi:hypothetical protein
MLGQVWAFVRDVYLGSAQFEADGCNLRPPQYLLQALAATAVAMASGPGRYAVEAAAGPLDAATNSDQVQQARVTEFQESKRLVADSGFAFRFGT